MDDIQRWDFFAEVGINEPVRYLHLEAVKGRYVTYADHVAAVAAAQQRVKSDFAKYLRHMVDDDKFAAGVKAAREAAEVALLGTLQTTRDRVLNAIDAVTTRGKGSA